MSACKLNVAESTQSIAVNPTEEHAVSTRQRVDSLGD